jgi:hypothetical protein
MPLRASIRNYRFVIWFRGVLKMLKPATSIQVLPFWTGLRGLLGKSDEARF